MVGQDITYFRISIGIDTSLNKPDLQASSLYRSSAVYFAQKNFALAKSAIDGALLHSRKAQEHIKGAVYADAALIYAAINNDIGNVTYAQRLLDQAESCLNMPFNDGIMNFSDGKYQLIKARTLVALNRPGKALECLDDAEVDIMPGERRRLAFLNILRAECYTIMKRPEYDRAVDSLMEALSTSVSINSAFNISHILRLYKLIAVSSYGNAPDVAELGMQLRALQVTR